MDAQDDFADGGCQPAPAVTPFAQVMSAGAPMIPFSVVSRSVHVSSLMSRNPSPWVGSSCEVSITVIAFPANPIRS